MQTRARVAILGLLLLATGIAIYTAMSAEAADHRGSRNSSHRLASYNNRHSSQSNARLEADGLYHIIKDGIAYRLDFPGSATHAEAAMKRGEALVALREGSQAAYNNAIPEYCLYAGKLRVIDALTYDALQSLDPLLLREPVHKIFANGETERMPAACQLIWIVGGIDVGVDLVRFARANEGAVLPDGGYLNALFIELGAALAVTAETDASARGYLDDLIRGAGWKSRGFRFSDSTEMASEYFVSALANGLVYAPSDWSVELLRAAAEIFPYSDNRIALINAFRASGARVKDYRREIFFEGKAQNAYVQPAAAPSNLPPTGARIEKVGNGPTSHRHGHGDGEHSHLSETEEIVMRDLLIARIAAHPEQCAQTIHKIGSLADPQVIVALPVIIAHLRAFPADRAAADSMLGVMRQVDLVINPVVLDEAMKIAADAGVRASSISLLKLKQDAIAEELRIAK